MPEYQLSLSSLLDIGGGGCDSFQTLNLGGGKAFSNLALSISCKLSARRSAPSCWRLHIPDASIPRIKNAV